MSLSAAFGNYEREREERKEGHPSLNCRPINIKPGTKSGKVFDFLLLSKKGAKSATPNKLFSIFSLNKK